MAINVDKVQDRFQLLLDQGYSPKNAMLVVVGEAVQEDRKDFAQRRDYRYSRINIQSHAEDLLERLYEQVPELKIMKDTIPTTPSHLAWMLDTVKAKAGEWPLDKLGRWIGYVQGVLVEQRKLDVQGERVRTRASYQVAYAADGLEVPETL